MPTYQINRKGKLSKKAEKLRFIEYSLKTKGYRLIDEGTSKVLVRRDVIFNEADFQYNSGKVEVTKEESGQEQAVIPEENEETIENPECEEHGQVDPEDEQHHYPRRHRSAPIWYGIDEYAGAVFLSASQIEEPKCIKEALKTTGQWNMESCKAAKWMKASRVQMDF